ncbi:hypothetical protein V6N11_067899 [Hibiscus sabdariffa]|uniref:Uncharacterized protein n=1 Tax=Hibiscus sabdariffa TaxID=183260 RepID=A0ABR2ST16_9ROSI
MGGGLKEIPQLVPKNQGKSSRLLEQTHEQKKDISQLEIDIIEKVNNGGPIWVDQISKKSLNVDGQNVESREDAIGAPPVINSIRNFGVENEVNSRAVEDIDNMSLLVKSNEIFSPESIKTSKQKSNWEFSVDKIFGKKVKSGCVSKQEGPKVKGDLEDRLSSSDIEEKLIEAK